MLSFHHISSTILPFFSISSRYFPSRSRDTEEPRYTLRLRYNSRRENGRWPCDSRLTATHGDCTPYSEARLTVQRSVAPSVLRPWLASRFFALPPFLQKICSRRRQSQIGQRDTFHQSPTTRFRILSIIPELPSLPIMHYLILSRN